MIVASEITLDSIAKARVHPGDADQDQPQYDEREDATYGLQLTQIVEENL